MAVKGIGQITISDLNDITASGIAPNSPTTNQLWLDTSTTPNKFKKWNGTAWEVTGASSLAQLDPTANTAITTHASNIQATADAIGLNLSTQTLQNTGMNSRLSVAESYITVNNNKIQSAVSQADINTSIGAVNIGGRNLLYGTKDFSSPWNIYGGGTIDPTKYLGFSVLYRDYSAAVSGYTDIANQYVYTPTIENRLETGAWYTLSFYVKGTGVFNTYVYPSVGDTTTYPIVDGVQSGTICPSDNGRSWTLTSIWTKHTYTFKVGNYARTTAQVLFRVMFGNIVYVCGAKLEKGNKATDWSPAPEDVDAKIDATNSLIVQTSKDWTATFKASGGYNLIKNGSFKLGVSSWVASIPTYLYIDQASTSGYEYEIKVLTGGAGQGITQTIYGLEIGKVYTASCYCKTVLGQPGLIVTNGSYPSALAQNINVWEWLEVTFTAIGTSVVITFADTGQTSGEFYGTAFALQRGATRCPWSPNSNELKNGNTVINADGVTINNGALVVKNPGGTVIIDGQSDMHKIIATGTIPAAFSGSKGEQVIHDIDIGASANYRPCFEVYFCDGGTNTTSITKKFPVMEYSIFLSDQIPRISATHDAYIAYVNGRTVLRIESMNWAGGGYVDNFYFRYYIYKEVSF